MRRRWAAAGAIGLVLLGIGGVGSATAEANNDTMATAQGPMTGSFTGAIDTENDVDWYFMYALGSTQLDIALTGLGPEESCQNWDALLKNSDGYELSSTRAHFNQVNHIRYTLPSPGTYYLEVTGFFCENVGNYRIDLAASPALLTSPPYVPPAATPPSGSGSGVSPGCRTARGRIASLSSRLRHTTSRRQRNRLRAKLRQARSTAANLC